MKRSTFAIQTNKSIIITLPPVKKSISCCSLTSKSTNIYFLELFWTTVLSCKRWSVHISPLIQTNIYFFIEERNIWEIAILARPFSTLMMDLWKTHAFSSCGLLWCFRSCLDSHSDGTHSLQSIHCWANDIMLHFFKSVWISCGWRFSANFHFPLKKNSHQTPTWLLALNLKQQFAHYGKIQQVVLQHCKSSKADFESLVLKTYVIIINTNMQFHKLSHKHI